MALRLQSIASKSAAGSGLVAKTHKNGISSVPKVVTSGQLPLLERSDLVARRSRET
jgi:hypothetical protein